ncbi:unnamed protein product [Closterium sp. NIES-65]|nr:unnamed protein product [Closterium sp. NIES-65]
MRGLGSVSRLLARQAARGSWRSGKELGVVVTRSEAVAILTSRRGLTTLGGCSKGPFAYNSNRAAMAMAECVAWRTLDRVRFMAADAGLPSAVLVPTMGESIKDGSISAVLKAAGESVEEDEVIAQIETDKVTIDVRSPRAGVLQKIEVKVGDTVTPGTTVAFVSPSSAAPPAKPAAGGVQAPSAAEAAVGPIGDEEMEGEGVDEYSLVHGDDTVEVVVPSMGESVNDGVLAALLKSVGDSVRMDEVIGQVETDKVRKRGVEGGVGDSVRMDEVIGQVETDKVIIDVCSPDEGAVESKVTFETLTIPLSSSLPLRHWQVMIDVRTPDEGVVEPVTIDVRSPDEGVVEAVSVQLGDTVTPGTPIAVVRRAKALPASTTLADRVVEAVEGPRPVPVARAVPPPPPPPPGSRPAAAAAPAGGPAVPIIPRQKERRVGVQNTHVAACGAFCLKDSQNTSF